VPTLLERGRQPNGQKERGQDVDADHDTQAPGDKRDRRRQAIKQFGMGIRSGRRWQSLPGANCQRCTQGAHEGPNADPDVRPMLQQLRPICAASARSSPVLPYLEARLTGFGGQQFGPTHAHEATPAPLSSSGNRALAGLASQCRVLPSPRDISLIQTDALPPAGLPVQRPDELSCRPDVVGRASGHCRSALDRVPRLPIRTARAHHGRSRAFAQCLWDTRPRAGGGTGKPGGAPTSLLAGR
jgi:hypothetical protein